MDKIDLPNYIYINPGWSNNAIPNLQQYSTANGLYTFFVIFHSSSSALTQLNPAFAIRRRTKL